MATAGQGASGAAVRAVSDQDLKGGEIGQHIVDGSLDDLEDGVVVGNRLAVKLGLKVGDDITLISPQGNTTAFGTVPRIKSYHVPALFSLGLSEYDGDY